MAEENPEAVVVSDDGEKHPDNPALKEKRPGADDGEALDQYSPSNVANINFALHNNGENPGRAVDANNSHKTVK